jgi:Xaa-Pro dipeptidase
MLEGFGGWSFPHHLGHGIGLSAHESPYLNPHWDDRFQAGDVFTVEPGLYGTDLAPGVRVEEIYHLSASGLRRLTRFPTGLCLETGGSGLGAGGSGLPAPSP